MIEYPYRARIGISTPWLWSMGTPKIVEYPYWARTRTRTRFPWGIVAWVPQEYQKKQKNSKNEKLYAWSYMHESLEHLSFITLLDLGLHFNDHLMIMGVLFYS